MRFNILLVLAAVFLLCLAGPVRAGEEARVMHMVVIDSDIAGVNYAQEMPELEKFFLRMAGGFTDLGKTRGATLLETGIARESNQTYIVAARKNIAKEIDAYVRERFTTGPYILSWSAEEFARPQ